MARRYDPHAADAAQMPIALEMIADPDRYTGGQLLWARAFLDRIERERAERIEHDDDGQGLLFGQPEREYPD